MSRLIANEELMVTVSVKAGTRRRLLALLDQPGVNLTPTQFIEWALRVATTALEPCQDDSGGFCVAHSAPGQEQEDGTFVCDGRDLVALG